ncbi:hypothetical protein PSHT_09628, partial [Puccinia striiformis]
MTLPALSSNCHQIMATGYENNYGSDWTRQRNLDDVTDCDMSTELGTTLSKSTAAPAPALQRLSFARHASVLGSSLGPAPSIEKVVRPVNQNTGNGIVFGTMAHNNSSQMDASSYDQSAIDVQAVLDGLTSKPMGLTDFKRFLNLIRQGAYQEHCNSWISSAPMLVDFLLDFKRYADGFSRLSLRDQSQCPHPFEIICHLNLQTPTIRWIPTQNGGFSQLENAACDLSHRMPGDFGYDAPTPAMELTNPNPPASRKVNWAPSVRSNNHQHDPDLDGTGSTLSATVHEGSILRTARYNSKAPSQLSSNFLMHKLKGVEPDHQPMRTAFNTLMMKYLGNSTSLEQRDGLLSSCDDINFESIQRTNLEAKLPIILLSSLESSRRFSLGSTNMSYPHSQRTQTNARSQTLWGSFLVLMAFIFNLLMMIVPSPLIIPLKMKDPIPRLYRLLLFPLIWMGIALILKELMKTYCLLCWHNKFRSPETGLRSDHGEARMYLDAQDNKYSNSSKKPQSEPIHVPAGRHEASRVLHQITTCMITSLVLAVIVQIAFVFLPLLP